jgi:hypothetical protein
VKRFVAATLCTLLLSGMAQAGAIMNIDSVVVDSTSGRTFAAVCQNTKGYFAELGPRSRDARFVLDADFRQEDLRSLMRKSVPSGWSIEFGRGLPEALTIDWKGRASWVDVLGEIARKGNFVVVVAWVQKSVYIDKL